MGALFARLPARWLEHRRKCKQPNAGPDTRTSTPIVHEGPYKWSKKHVFIDCVCIRVGRWCGGAGTTVLVSTEGGSHATTRQKYVWDDHACQLAPVARACTACPRSLSASHILTSTLHGFEAPNVDTVRPKVRACKRKVHRPTNASKTDEEWRRMRKTYKSQSYGVRHRTLPEDLGFPSLSEERTGGHERGQANQLDQ